MFSMVYGAGEGVEQVVVRVVGESDQKGGEPVAIVTSSTKCTKYEAKYEKT